MTEESEANLVAKNLPLDEDAKRMRAIEEATSARGLFAGATNGTVQEKVDGAVSLLVGPMPIEVQQLRSWTSRVFLRALLIGTFVVAMIFFVVMGVRSERKSTFVSLERTAGRCSNIFTPTFSGSFELDEFGVWSNSPDYEPTKELLRLEFKDFPAERYSEALGDAEAGVHGLDARSNSLMDNLLLALIWKQERSYSDGESTGALSVSFAADASAVYDAKSVYVGVTGCPSGAYSSSYGYATSASATRFEYHVETTQDTTTVSWESAAFDACIAGASGIRIDDWLGVELANAIVVDAEKSLRLGWFSISLAAAINHGVVGDPASFLEELDPALFNFGNSSDDFDDFYYYYSSSSSSEDSASRRYEEYMSNTLWTSAWEWSELSYENATELYCPKHVPASFFFFEKKKKSEATALVRFFTDDRAPGMDPLACIFEEEDGFWLCSVVLGDVHAYPYLQLWNPECNSCSRACETSAGGAFSADFVGGLFLKSVRDGPFTTRPFGDTYWNDVADSFDNLHYVSQYMSYYLQVWLEWDWTSDYTAAFAACTLDWDLPYVAFDVYEGDGNLPGINDNGNVADPDEWHCATAWTDKAAAALAKVRDSDNAPEVLFENYFECKPTLSAAWMTALGVGLSNARTLFFLFSLLVTAGVMQLIASYRPAWLQHGMLVTEDDIQDHALVTTFQQKAAAAAAAADNDERHRRRCRLEEREEEEE